MPYYYDGENYFREADEEPSTPPEPTEPRVNYYDTRGDTSNYSYYKTPTERVVSVPNKPNDYDKYGKEITQYFLARGMKRREAAVRAQQVLESMQVEKTAEEKKRERPSSWKKYAPWGAGALATAGLVGLARGKGHVPTILKNLVQNEGKLTSAGSAINKATRGMNKAVDHGNVIPTLVGPGGISTTAFGSVDDAVAMLDRTLARNAGEYSVSAGNLNKVLGPSNKSQSWTEYLPKFLGGVGKTNVKPHMGLDVNEINQITRAHNQLNHSSLATLKNDAALLSGNTAATSMDDALAQLHGVDLSSFAAGSREAAAAGRVSTRIRALELAKELQSHENKLHSLVRESQQVANDRASHILAPLVLGGIATPLAAEAYMSSSAPLSPNMQGVKGPAQLFKDTTGLGQDPVTKSVSPHLRAVGNHVSEYAPYYGVAAAAAAPLAYYAFNRGPSREELRIRGRA